MEQRIIYLLRTYVRTHFTPTIDCHLVDHGSLAWRLQVKLWQCGVPVVPWFCPSLSELWNLKRFKSRLHLVKYLYDSAVGILCLQRTVQLVNVVDGGHLSIRTVNCELWDTQEVQNANSHALMADSGISLVTGYLCCLVYYPFYSR